MERRPYWNTVSSNASSSKKVGIFLLSSMLAILAFLQIPLYEYHKITQRQEAATSEKSKTNIFTRFPPSTTGRNHRNEQQGLSLLRQPDLPLNVFAEEPNRTVPFVPRIQRRNPLPSLESLVATTIARGSTASNSITNNESKTSSIVGDVSDMLDFAIIGFAKAGTSTMMEYLNQPPISIVFQEEQCHIGYDKPAKLIPKLHRTLSNAKTTTNVSDTTPLIGIKCPRNIDDSMINFSTYFPYTKFIIALRHPVYWFQSMYNFRIHNEGIPLPHPNLLLTGHISGARGVFANRVRYHHMLGRLGKTPLREERELSLVFYNSTKLDIQVFYNNLLLNTGNKIFLYHMEQLPPSTLGMLPPSFVTDLSNFLGLQTNLPRHSIRRWIPGKIFPSKELRYRESLKIDICDEEYRPLRNVLVENGKISAQWIREYFLKSPDVVTPSGTSFNYLMDQWSIDPCVVPSTATNF